MANRKPFVDVSGRWQELPSGDTLVDGKGNPIGGSSPGGVVNSIQTNNGAGGFTGYAGATLTDTGSGMQLKLGYGGTDATITKQSTGLTVVDPGTTFFTFGDYISFSNGDGTASFTLSAIDASAFSATLDFTIQAGTTLNFFANESIGFFAGTSLGMTAATTVDITSGANSLATLSGGAALTSNTAGGGAKLNGGNSRGNQSSGIQIFTAVAGGSGNTIRTAAQHFGFDGLVYTQQYDTSNKWTQTITNTGGLTWAGAGTGGSLTVTPTAGKEVFLNTSTVVVPKTKGTAIKVDIAAPTYSWRDIIGYIAIDYSGANSATLAAFAGGSVRRPAFSAGDKADLEFHIPHDYAPGTDLYIHFHWAHNGTAISGNIVGTFVSTYAKGHNQAAFSAEKTVTATYNTVNIATTPRYQHRIEEVQLSSVGGSATLLNTSDIEVDGVIGMNFTMTTIPTITGGTPNEPFVFFIDIHYQSTELGTKQKSPDFWT